MLEYPHTLPISPLTPPRRSRRISPFPQPPVWSASGPATLRLRRCGHEHAAYNAVPRGRQAIRPIFSEFFRDLPSFPVKPHKTQAWAGRRNMGSRRGGRTGTICRNSMSNNTLRSYGLHGRRAGPLRRIDGGRVHQIADAPPYGDGARLLKYGEEGDVYLIRPPCGLRERRRPGSGIPSPPRGILVATYWPPTCCDKAPRCLY